MKETVSFNDSSNQFYQLNMYQTWTDQAGWIEGALSTITDMRSVSYVWARAARLVFTSVLAPNDLEYSIFRSGLVVNGLEYLGFEYYGELSGMKS